MSYKIRTILFVFFVLAFVVMTTFFSLYAAGYRFSLASIMRGEALIQRTGILVLDSKPRGAEISLWRQFRGVLFDDNVLRNKNLRTPYKIKNLLPGEYVLNLELDGYWPWQQRVNIYSGQSSYVEDIVLFRRNLPINFINTLTQKISLCPLDKKIILEDDRKMVDLKTEQEISLGDNVSDIDFLEAGLLLLNNNLVFDYLNNEYRDLQKDYLSNSRNIKMRLGDLFYIKDGLKSYNIKSEKEDIIFSFDNIIDFDVLNDSYFLILKESEGHYFQVYSQRHKNLINSVKLPDSDNYEILSIGGSSDFAYIFDKNINKIYVINLSFKFDYPWKVVDNVSGFSFVDGDNFVYHSDSEIYMFNATLAEKFIISRLDHKIKSLVWHPKNYIIYSTDKDIFILDLKYNNQVINLVSLEKVSNLVLDRLGSVLYFTGKIGNQEGLYKLFIQ
jgi:hypothetical protein